MILQDTVQLCWDPARSQMSPLVSFERNPQHVLHVFSNQLGQLGWKAAGEGEPAGKYTPANYQRQLVGLTLSIGGLNPAEIQSCWA